MIKVNCTAVTCKFNSYGICRCDEIELIDFEYYKDVEDRENNRLEDDMKCVTYKSIYSRD